MSELIQKLTAAGEAHKGTDLGGLLQWAALHVDGQDEVICDLREMLQRETKDHETLKAAFAHATAAVEIALAALRAPICPEIEFSRDLSGHINLMASHGDPDYLMASGKSIRHVDLRSTKPKNAFESVPAKQNQDSQSAPKPKGGRRANTPSLRLGKAKY